MSKRPAIDPRYVDPDAPGTRCCDVPECAGSGEYRAPKGRHSLTEYYWFCLDHVRAYNAAWDYYAGMSTHEIEAAVRLDVTWQRPTWPMGGWRSREQLVRDAVFNGFVMDDGEGIGRYHHANPHEPPPVPRTIEDEALAVLNLAAPVTFTVVKARYRSLAKKHHPDANGGDKAAEERLKHINQAYNILKASYHLADSLADEGSGQQSAH